ncbi:MAG: hypothetical protein IT320_09535 [Anaerolineae bacterium]|nr:hypothetical protein [Anaerolineae bacterium]
MADSLFDNRYRYDYIYPRGRSGETLRAVDTQDNDRPVVVKRPAPHDAPPIRSGQEVSILNERKALSRLAGHPSLTELLGGGQFYVSGIVHQYIVVERAQGTVIADFVRELAARGERMPDLEMLVIVDILLDMLVLAHERDIVYNDVDAKHLFWDREHYRLKVIDWGNAVFLEGDEATPQGVSRQSDIYQVGELLYFMLTGGARMEVPRDAGEDFRLDFGEDDSRIPQRLQTIVSRAAHPNVRLRYRTIGDLRRDLIEYRTPLERDRDSAVTRLLERLRQNRSKEELHGMLQTLEPVLLMDPGYPEARRVFSMIEDRLSDLEVAADLDAAHIYLDSANWARAASLLDELRGKTRGDTAVLVKLLRDWARMLERAGLHPTPLAVMDGIALIFDGDPGAAAYAVLTQDSTDERVMSVGLLLAERVAAHYGEVTVLHPNLYRLSVALDDLAADNVPVAEVRQMLTDIRESLIGLSNNGGRRKRAASKTATPASLIDLRDGYRATVDQLATLGALIDSTIGHDNNALRKLPLDTLERATQATMALADNMHVIGKHAASSPRDARAALESSRAIDPGAAAWESLQKLLDGLYELLQSYQTYIPAADGSDLAGWLNASARDLEPFAERLFDEMLNGMIAGLGRAAENWAAYAEATVTGSRIGAVTALVNATEAIGTVSPTLAGWLNHLRTTVASAPYVERHALYGALGRALADGWENFDKGRVQDAERLGAQAYEAARNETEQTAAMRLRDLSEVTRGWIERGGVGSADRTKAALQTVDNLFTPEQRQTRVQFNRQMPSQETYLRAMGKGLVEQFGRSSSAAVRVLFVSYMLQSAQDASEDQLEDAEFWREAGQRVLGDAGLRHPITKAIDELVARRRDLLYAATLLNEVDHAGKLATLDEVRKRLEESPQAKILSPAVFSLRELTAATRDWADGEFRAAGIKLENAIKAIDEVEASAQITLTHYRAWLLDLLNAAAELHNQMRKMQVIIEQRPDAPDSFVRSTHRALAETTGRLLGGSYATTIRQWRDTYEQFLGVYTDPTTRRSAKLSRFNELFRALFIDRHPAYPLYRHWYTQTDAAPEFPAPPTDEPTPRLAETDDVEEAAEVPVFSRTTAVEDEPEPRRGSRLWLLLIPLLIVIAVGAYLLLNGGPGGDGGDDATPTATADAAAIASGAAPTLPTPTPIVPTDEPPTSIALINTLPAAATNPPSATPTETPVTPSGTPTPTLTHTPSATPTPSITPLPPQGVQGVQNLLTMLSGMETADWSVEQFGPLQEGAVWRLGAGGPTGSDPIVIPLTPDLLEEKYGNEASRRIISVEADLQLESYNPALLLDDEVYFGLVYQDAADPIQTAGVQINLVRTGVVNVGQRVGDINAVISQRSLGDVRVRLRLDRNPETGAVTTFINGEPVGLPLPLDAPEGVIPALYVKDGGVIVYLSSWTVALR